MYNLRRFCTDLVKDKFIVASFDGIVSLPENYTALKPIVFTEECDAHANAKFKSKTIGSRQGH